jgi:hypothetical protein
MVKGYLNDAGLFFSMEPTRSKITRVGILVEAFSCFNA